MARAVEERLNVDIEETLTGFWDMVSKVGNLVASGDTTFSCMNMMDRFGFAAAQKNYFLPIQELEYIDLNREYWGYGLTESFSIDGKNFFAVSSFNLKSFHNTACVLINTNIASDQNVSIPYDKVDDGTWTLDVMLDMAKNVSRDVNGDGVMNGADVYGIGMYDRRSAPVLMWISSGMRIVENDADGMIEIAIYDNEEFYSILQKTQDIFYYGDNAITIEQYDDFSTINIFKDGRQMILVGAFISVTQLRDKEDDFTILPVPKYKESQSSYYSRTFDSYFALVPKTVFDTEMTGAVLEAMSCKAYQTVIPAYIETTLKEKLSRDTQSPKYIQLAFDTRVIDIGAAFMYDVFGDGALYELLRTKPVNVSSYLQINRKKIDKTLQRIIDTITVQD